MREIVTEIDIRARAARVWEILMDFEHYPSWNPFIKRIAGRPKVGSRLEVVIAPAGSKPMRFTPKVLAARPGRELRWKGRLFLPGIFDGEHAFVIETEGKSSVRFVQRERFSGILVPFFWGRLNVGTKKGFVSMNKALKARAEKMGKEKR